VHARNNAFRPREVVDEKTISRSSVKLQGRGAKGLSSVTRLAKTQGTWVAGLFHTGRMSFANRMSNCQLKLACGNELGCNCKLPEIDEEAWQAQPCDGS